MLHGDQRKQEPTGSLEKLTQHGTSGGHCRLSERRAEQSRCLKTTRLLQQLIRTRRNARKLRREAAWSRLSVKAERERKPWVRREKSSPQASGPERMTSRLQGQPWRQRQ